MARINCPPDPAGRMAHHAIAADAPAGVKPNPFAPANPRFYDSTTTDAREAGQGQGELHRGVLAAIGDDVEHGLAEPDAGLRGGVGPALPSG